MAWIDSTPDARPPATRREALLRQACDAAPRDSRLRLALAEALFDLGRFDEAIGAAELALAAEGDRFAGWPVLATAMLRARGADAVLDLCDHRWAAPGDSRWHLVRGRALHRLGRGGEARSDFARAVAIGDSGFAALRALLESLAADREAEHLLRYCEAPLPHLQGNAAIRGYHALALSLLGRGEDANRLVDLDAMTSRVPFEPPAEFGGIDAFNATLAADILRDRPGQSRQTDVDANYAMRIRHSPALDALRAFIRTALRSYADRLPSLGLPPAPEQARIGCGTVVLRRQGRNGQHLHAKACLTSVYHVVVPQPGSGHPHAGALAMGVCDEIAPGHRASWGERHLAAAPGWLTIFPAHIFHDVVATGSTDARITVVADLDPLA
ncbi:putative 2OG-Fe(II) oxygenase [Sphingomonas sp. HF-S3]|uniref:2OG-Fe(II) oxygenase n=1 Tax=Sphingomonas rustica TaxID=3103142 RepID=A0ABV0BCU4_9SPHN